MNKTLAPKENTENACLGIDENGLGPLMGPLIVTGCLVKKQKETESWEHIIDDSKSFFNNRTRGSFVKLEEAVIAIFHSINGRMPASPAEIIEAFCGRKACMSGLDLCTKLPNTFTWADPQNAAKRCKAFSLWLYNNGITLLAANSHIICTRRLNNFFKKGGTKFNIDFLTFCSIIKEFSEIDGISIECGKIGGMKYYKDYLMYNFPTFIVETVCQSAQKSIYRLATHERRLSIGFFMNVEKRSFPAAVASVIGKYIREITMAGIREALDIKEDISGYHDIKTRAEVAGIRLKGLPGDCLFRNK